MIKDIYLKGHTILQAKASQEEKTKSGKLRGGNTGLLTKEGDYVGKCAAKTWLRFQGIDTSSLSFPMTNVGEQGDKINGRELMFEGGRSNEDSWLAVLQAGYDGKILCEEDIPTKWFTEDSVPVTGRPDIVLVDDNDKPIRGIELKQASSLWTARDVLFNKMPKLDHLAQACHYGWQLGCPFELWYTGRTDFHIGSLINLFPEIGSEDSKWLEYGYYRLGKINPKTKRRIKHRSDKLEYDSLPDRDKVREPLKVLPFIQGFKIQVDKKGVVYYCDAMPATESWVKTVLNINDIERYYNSIPKLKEVPAKPKMLKPTGEKLNYTADKYCELAPKGLCCGQCKGMDINKWASEVKKL